MEPFHAGEQGMILAAVTVRLCRDAEGNSAKDHDNDSKFFEQAFH
jgi:hypothetical protein